jgi:predicted lipid-binding transport protein (Tim44 family)
MANSPGELGRPDKTDPQETAPDRSAGHRQAARFLHPVESADEHLFHAQQIAADQERLIDLEQQEFDGVVAALKDRTPAELPGVDLSAIKQVDSGFDDEAFRAIARETFKKVREARTLQNPQESADLLSPQMQTEMQSAISGDVASHRHHLLPFLWVNDAVIAAAEVVGGQEEIDVRFSISAAEEEVDDRNGQVLAGDSTAHSWEERWRFRRDPQADTSVSDERHEITDVRTDQWLVAHRGWIVTEITRLPAG